MTNNFSKKLTSAIKRITKRKKSYLHEPYFDNDEVKTLNKCVKSTFVSSVGPDVKNFEKKISKLTGSRYVVAVINGTSALHLSLKLIGADRDSEILIPSLNFVAGANAIKYCEATPHFVDSDENSLCVDYYKLKKYLKKQTFIKNGNCYNKTTKKKIIGLILVHVFGNSNKVPEIKKLCDRYKINLVEDAAEAIGSYYKKKHLGTFGKIGILSFNGNKPITTGGGGAILTNDKKIAKKALNLSTTGKVPHEWKLEYNSVAFNYRLPNLNASLGLAQLKKIKKILSAKKNLYFKYKKVFNQFTELKLLDTPKFCKSNYWLNTLILKSESFSKRNYIINYLNKYGVQARPTWKLLHKLPHFSKCPKMNLKISEKMEKKIINIPSSPIYGMK